MNGTEKQIKWANEIRSNIINTLESIKSCAQPAGVADLNNKIERLNNAEEAGSIINIFKDIRFSGNTKDDFLQILSYYRIHSPNTPDEHNILGK